MATVDKDSEEREIRAHRICRARRGGGEFAWVHPRAARPLTGRTHQIRVHLASHRPSHHRRFQIWRHAGARRRKGDIADKLHLHARSIDIARPDGGRLAVIAPLPPHMRKSWELLGFDPGLSGRRSVSEDRAHKAEAAAKTATKVAADKRSRSRSRNDGGRSQSASTRTPPPQRRDGGFTILLDGKPVKDARSTRGVRRAHPRACRGRRGGMARAGHGKIRPQTMPPPHHPRQYRHRPRGQGTRGAVDRGTRTVRGAAIFSAIASPDEALEVREARGLGPAARLSSARSPLRSAAPRGSPSALFHVEQAAQLRLQRRARRARRFHACWPFSHRSPSPAYRYSSAAVSRWASRSLKAASMLRAAFALRPHR